MEKITKSYLTTIAKTLDLKGISKLTKKELITFILENPCINITIEDCEKLSRNELRGIARMCNVKISNKKMGPICNELFTKYQNIDKTEFLKFKNNQGKTHSPPTKTHSPPTKTRSPPTKTRSPPTKTRSPPTKTRSPPTKTRSPKQEIRDEILEEGEIPPTKTRSPKPKIRDEILEEGEIPPIVISTNKTPKDVVKELITANFDKLIANRSTNFTDAIKVAKDNALQIDCKLNVKSVKEFQNDGLSGAGIFNAMMQSINKNKSNVVIKMWKVYENYNFKKTTALSCLDGEWKIYTYIMPFLFFENITPNVLIPIDSGICTAQELKPHIQNINMDYTEIAKYVTTPFIKDSFVTFLNCKKNKVDTTDIYFQTIFTLAAFAKIGLRHNDCHTNNIRIIDCYKNPFKIAYKLKFTTIYCTTNHLSILNDFDRTGVYPPISKLTDIINLCTVKGGYYCEGLNQCDANVGGKRDLLIFSYYMFNTLEKPLRKFIYEKFFTYSPAARAHFTNFIVFDKNKLYIDYAKSYSHEFLFMNLTDKKLFTMYVDIDTFLNYPEFLQIIVNTSPSLKTNVENTKDFGIYTFYDIDITQKYKHFVKK